MGDRKKQFGGEEGRPYNPGRISPSSNTEPPSSATAGSCQECLSDTKYAELLEQEKTTLLRIAAARIRNTCSDPSNHKEDIAQQGALKFWRAASRRDTDYEDPAKVLRGAVWQEGVSHSETCRREQAVDLNSLDDRSEERDAPNSNGYKTSELLRKTSFNPVEVYNTLLDLHRKLNGVDKKLFVMRYVEGLTLTEIAERRGCAVSTVRRAVEKLKRELGWVDKEEPPEAAPNS